jgi:hypothetical protein
MSLTDEQKAIMRAPIRGKEVIVIKAYAGTGKTFILTELAHRLKQEFSRTKVIYLAYNKAIAAEAREKFPPNVTCMTTHGLAAREVGKPYFERKKVWNPKKSYIKKAMDDWYMDMIEEMKEEDWPKAFKAWVKHTGPREYVPWDVVNCAWESMGMFLNSDRMKFSMGENIPTDRLAQCNVSPEIIKLICTHLWKRMQDLNDRFPMIHDGYLKLYDIQKKDLGEKYKIILFDEAQDANGAQLNIVRRANACKIIVGDAHQQIYAWRGSVNALDKFQATQTYRLSNSFRFGEQIARWATSILKTWKEEDVPVTGMKPEDHVQYASAIEKTERYAYITRTNAEMFSKAVMCLQSGRSFGFVGGFPNDLARDILDVYYLYSRQRDEIQNNFYKFPDYETLTAYAIKAEDLEVMKLLGIVNKYGYDIPSIIDDIRNMETDEKYASCVLVTGHRSKGLEWDNVMIAPDFLRTFLRMDGDVEEGERAPVDRMVFTRLEAANLLYVVLTRARFRLGIPKSLCTFITDSYTFKERLESGEDVDELENEFRGDLLNV